MEEKELQELEDFSLEDIIREFSDHPAEVKQAAEEAPEETLPEPEAVAEEEPQEEAAETETEEAATAEEEKEIPKADFSDTIRVDPAVILKGTDHNAQPIEEEPEEKADTVPLEPQQIPQEQEKTEPAFTGEWEPEYEQPMGNYVPPQPIAFPSRAESREMKRDRKSTRLNSSH